MARGQKKQRLNFFLLKVDVPIDEAVRDYLAGVEPFAISDKFPFPGEIWIRPSEAHSPPSYRFVQSGLLRRPRRSRSKAFSKRFSSLSRRTSRCRLVQVFLETREDMANFFRLS
jgi:hypothetical protein